MTVWVVRSESTDWEGYITSSHLVGLNLTKEGSEKRIEEEAKRYPNTAMSGLHRWTLREVDVGE